MTFLGEDLNVVPTTLVIDIVDNIDNVDNTTTSVLVEQYNIVSMYIGIVAICGSYIHICKLFHFY